MIKVEYCPICDSNVNIAYKDSELKKACPKCGCRTTVTVHEQVSDYSFRAMALHRKTSAQGYTIKCPSCGSGNVHEISAAGRAVSLLTLGIASNKIGKHYKCDRCKYTW